MLKNLLYTYFPDTTFRISSNPAFDLFFIYFNCFSVLGLLAGSPIYKLISSLISNYCLELIFGKWMRTATFQFSESGGSVNGPDLFTELPFLQKSLPNPAFTEFPPPPFTEEPFYFTDTPRVKSIGSLESKRCSREFKLK